MKYFVDSNIFLRFLIQENPKVFNDCSNFLKMIKMGKINAVTSDLVVSEIVWVMDSFYNKSKLEIVKGVGGIVKINNLKLVEDYNTNLALEIFSTKNVKFIDALIASNSKIQMKKITVVSYDKDFDKLGVKRLEPSDIINRG